MVQTPLNLLRIEDEDEDESKGRFLLRGHLGLAAPHYPMAFFEAP